MGAAVSREPALCLGPSQTQRAILCGGQKTGVPCHLFAFVLFGSLPYLNHPFCQAWVIKLTVSNHLRPFSEAYPHQVQCRLAFPCPSPESGCHTLPFCCQALA